MVVLMPLGSNSVAEEFAPTLLALVAKPNAATPIPSHKSGSRKLEGGPPNDHIVPRASSIAKPETVGTRPNPSEDAAPIGDPPSAIPPAITTITLAAAAAGRRVRTAR